MFGYILIKSYSANRNRKIGVTNANILCFAKKTCVLKFKNVYKMMGLLHLSQKITLTCTTNLQDVNDLFCRHFKEEGISEFFFLNFIFILFL